MISILKKQVFFILNVLLFSSIAIQSETHIYNMGLVSINSDTTNIFSNEFFTIVKLSNKTKKNILLKKFVLKFLIKMGSLKKHFIVKFSLIRQILLCNQFPLYQQGCTFLKLILIAKLFLNHHLQWLIKQS